MFKKRSHREKALKYLLGPVTSIDSKELPLYSNAIFCMTDVDQVDSTDQQDGKKLFEPISPLAPPLKRQTYKMWKASMDLGWRLRHIKRRKAIYIQPIDDFPDFLQNLTLDGQTVSFFELLRRFASIYFMGFDVHLQPLLSSCREGWSITSRFHKLTNQKQLLAIDLQRQLYTVLPKDGCCVLGITWTDLYPKEELNFVLGEAHSRYYSGVFSFGRFEPKAYRDGQPPLPIEQIDGPLIWKMIKVLSHETCHLFGLAHCVFFRCAMNESTSLAEALEQPLQLCPVCLRKLQKVCKFDVLDRYLHMLGLLEAVQIHYPCEHVHRTLVWLKECVRVMETGQAAG